MLPLRPYRHYRPCGTGKLEPNTQKPGGPIEFLFLGPTIILAIHHWFVRMLS